MKFEGYAPTAISLLAANLFTIAIAVTQGWGLLQLLWVYWFQSVIIGVFNYLRILNLKEFSTDNFLVNDRPVKPTEKTKRETARDFAFGWGLTHLLFAAFLITLPSHGPFNAALPSEEEMFAAYSQNRPPNIPLSDNPQGWTPTLPLSVLPWMLVSILAFLANHYYSYVYYKNKPSKKKHNIGTIFFYPYARIIPMHFLMVGGAIWTTGPEVQSVILFLVLKTCADLIMHYIEHHEGWI